MVSECDQLSLSIVVYIHSEPSVRAFKPHWHSHYYNQIKYFCLASSSYSSRGGFAIIDLFLKELQQLPVGVTSMQSAMNHICINFALAYLNSGLCSQLPAHIEAFFSCSLCCIVLFREQYVLPTWLYWSSIKILISLNVCFISISIWSVWCLVLCDFYVPRNTFQWNQSKYSVVTLLRIYIILSKNIMHTLKIVDTCTYV